MESEKVLNNIDFLACPKCSHNLALEGNGFLCENCEAVYDVKDSIPILLPPEKNENKYDMDYIEHYEKDAENFDYFSGRDCKATEHDERRLREYIISLVPGKSTNMLDVGSGGAWVAEEFSTKNSNVFSLDISERNIRTALQNIDNDNHFGVVGDALNPPFRKNSFECIIASEVIEHIVSPKDFVKSLMNLLKPGGQLIVSTPYEEVLHYSQCIHCNRLTPKNAHLHSFNEKILTALYNEDDLDETKYYIFGNKALTQLRTHVILKYFPFSLWKLKDSFANFIINKPAHIVVVFIKKLES